MGNTESTTIGLRTGSLTELVNVIDWDLDKTDAAADPGDWLTDGTGLVDLGYCGRN